MRLLLVFTFIFFLRNVCFSSEDDTLPKGKSSRFLVFPFVVRSPETDWGFGLASAYFFKAKKNEDQLRTSDINIISLYTLREQTVVVLGSTIYFPGEREILRLQSSYSHYPDKFWGLGNKSAKNQEEDYSIKQILFNPQIIIKVFNKLFVGASLELQDVRDFKYKAGGIFETQNIVGRNGGFTAGAGILFTYDSRNNSYSPSHGMFTEINITRFSDNIGSDFNFTSYTMDVRKFMPAGRNRVLAAQAFARFNDGSTPLRYLSMLGGTEMMRGYYKGRYTDQDMMAFQAELRQYLFWRIGVVGFAAAGQVGNSEDNFGLGKFHYAYGTGLRLMLNEKEKLNLRIDFGFGEKSSGIYVILKEAF